MTRLEVHVELTKLLVKHLVIYITAKTSRRRQRQAAANGVFTRLADKIAA